MIVRLLGEGQFELPEASLARLNVLDDALQASLERDDAAAVMTYLQEMATLVRAEGQPLAADNLVNSDAVVPPADASPAEVRALLREEGLIPN